MKTVHYFRARLSKTLFAAIENLGERFDTPDSDPRVQTLHVEKPARYFFLMGYGVTNETETFDIQTMSSTMVKRTEYESVRFAINFKEKLIELFGKRSHIQAVGNFLYALSPDDFLIEDLNLDLRDIVQTLEDAGLVRDILSLTWKLWDIREGRLKTPTLQPADLTEAKKILNDTDFVFTRGMIEVTQPNFGAKLKVAVNGSIGYSAEDEEVLEEMTRRLILAIE